MSYEIVRQVENDFSEIEQWNSFLELIKYKDSIRNTWLEKLKSELNDSFAVNNSVKDWSYISRNIWDYRWYITEFGHESFCLTFNSHSLHLWANRNVFNIKKISELLNQQNYSPILSAFDRIDENHGEDSDYKIIERGNFIFANDNDGNYNIDQLSWFANYKTIEFAEQVKRKIDSFRRNQDITNLFIKINEETKL